MELLFLGTGGVTGVPTWSCDCEACSLGKNGGKNNRTRAAAVVFTKNHSIVIDTGPDFREQMLREGITHADYFLLTHNHMDHRACLYELRAAGKTRLLIPQAVIDDLKSKKSLDIFNYVPSRNLEITIEPFKPFEVDGVKVDSVELLHKKDYSTSPPCYGFTFEEKGFKLAYLSDFNDIVEKEKVQNLDLLVCDGATRENKWGHVGIEGGLEIYKELKPKRMLFTHVAHHVGTHEELSEYVKKFGNIGIAYDGMRVISSKE